MKCTQCVSKEHSLSLTDVKKTCCNLGDKTKITRWRKTVFFYIASEIVLFIGYVFYCFLVKHFTLLACMHETCIYKILLFCSFPCIIKVFVFPSAF